MKIANPAMIIPTIIIMLIVIAVVIMAPNFDTFLRMAWMPVGVLIGSIFSCFCE